MHKTVKEDLRLWAQEYVPRFNKLAKEFDTCYYTQSPLSHIDDSIDTLILGINPKGDGKVSSDNETNLSVEEFLDGNKCWGSRLDEKWKFVDGARWFLGYNHLMTSDSVDDDKKTVWANLTPFVSNKGFSDLRPELVSVGIESTLRLIEILKPKRIVLLTKEGFRQLNSRKVPQNIKDHISCVQVLESPTLEIGMILGVPTVCVPHPSGQWPVSNKFTSIFVLLHNLSCRDANGKIRKNIDEVRNIMREEIKALQTKVIL